MQQITAASYSNKTIYILKSQLYFIKQFCIKYIKHHEIY
jgi:hypothetical protein